MDSFLAARSIMAVSLGFHIIIAAIGMTMPFFLFVAELKWRRTGNEVYLKLAKAWARGVAMFFAVGAVSGTLLSFELGMLWPEFMEYAGPIVGMPFSLEGAAFFIEAIALGLYLYGRKRLHPTVHLGSALLIGIAGVASGFLVIAANGWMNSPSGFGIESLNVDQGIFIPKDVDPIAAMLNRAWISQSTHMTIAAFASTGFAVAGLHALLLLRGKNKPFHRAASRIALTFGAVAAIIMPISGDLSAKNVAKRQPEKLAAMEALYETKEGAPLLIGGIPDEKNQTVRYAIEIPGFLSFLAYGDFDAEVKGLNDLGEEKDWPPVSITHYSFQIMVMLGMLMAGVALLYFLFVWRWKHMLDKRWWLKLLVIMIPSGFIAIEAGWIVTELGRQPWIIYKYMYTVHALTSMPGLQYPLIVITLVYISLTMLIVFLMARQIRFVNQDTQTEKAP